ncbi:MAG: hypothetical protein FWH48_06240 [Oscillospiraceae bacterium]|nr:hypothetical protein [Oscillospiraceae bacterium]
MKTQASDKKESHNIAVFVLFTVISGVAANICSEGYIQAYLLKLGFDTDDIKNYGILTQVANIVAFLALTRLPPMKKRMIKIYAAAVLCTGAFPLVLALAGHILSFAAVYAAILVAAMLYGFLVSFRSVAEFGMMPHLFSRGLYGSAASKAMFIGGVVTMGISICSNFLFGHDGESIYGFLFFVPVAALIVSAFLALSYKYDDTKPEKPPPRITYYNIAKTLASPWYAKKLLPHFFRGVSAAGTYYVIPLVFEKIAISDGEKSFLIVISVMATLVGSFLFMCLNKKMNSGLITLAAMTICAAILPILVVCGDKYVFFALYLAFSISGIVFSISIPTGVLRSTPNEELSLITSLRFVLMSIATSLFIFIFGILLKHISPVYIMLFSSIIFVWCGFLCKKQFDDRL